MSTPRDGRQGRRLLNENCERCHVAQRRDAIVIDVDRDWDESLAGCDAGTDHERSRFSGRSSHQPAPAPRLYEEGRRLRSRRWWRLDRDHTSLDDRLVGDRAEYRRARRVYREVAAAPGGREGGVAAKARPHRAVYARALKAVRFTPLISATPAAFVVVVPTGVAVPLSFSVKEMALSARGAPPELITAVRVAVRADVP